jgi:hypothetical protein
MLLKVKERAAEIFEDPENSLKSIMSYKKFSFEDDEI